jgi:AbrB family looped-hinge helix DNA binding protein
VKRGKDVVLACSSRRLPTGDVIDTIVVIPIADRYGGAMDTITVSPKFQVVIPKQMRESLKLTPGQKIQALLYDNRIELIPVRPIKKMRGFLRGIDTTVDREKDRL